MQRSQQEALNSAVMAGNPRLLFQLMDMIGSGSYGSVYKALYAKTRAMAAVKVINIEAGESLQDVLVEVNILRECNHPNIVAYYGCYMTSDQKGKPQLWIGMEFCAGGSLEGIMKTTRRGFTEREIVCLLADALQGMAYLHAERRIHRDLKCGNLLLTDAGQVKLADFGVSAQLTVTMNKRKSVIGSPYWMAPEVISAEDTDTAYNEKADVWSIAITAIEMAECAPPYYELHPMRALFVIPKNKPPHLKHKDKFTSDFNDFLAKCLRKNPKKRPEAIELLQHPFITKASKLKPAVVIKDIIIRYKEAAAQYEGAPPSGPVELEEEEDAPAPAPVQITPPKNSTIVGPPKVAAAPPQRPLPGQVARPAAAPSIQALTPANNSVAIAAAAAVKSSVRAPPVTAIPPASQPGVRKPSAPLAAPAPAAAPARVVAPMPQRSPLPASVQPQMQQAAAAAQRAAPPPSKYFVGSSLKANQTPYTSAPTMSRSDTIKAASAAPIPAPLPSAASSSGAGSSSTVKRAAPSSALQDVIEHIVSMGFQQSNVIAALRQTNNVVDDAVALLLSSDGSSDDSTAVGLLENHWLADAAGDELPSPTMSADSVRRQMEADEMMARRLMMEEAAAVRRRQIPITPGRFTIERDCTLRPVDQITCADHWEGEQIFMLGFESGLFAIDYSGQLDRTALPLSTRPYYRMVVLEHLNVMVSVSGGTREVCIHDLSPLQREAPAAGDRRESKVARFETKTQVKRMPHTKFTEEIQIDQIGSSTFLLITKPKNVLLITNWAPHPYNRFMSVKEVAFDRPWSCVGVHEGAGGDLMVFVGFAGYFQIVDLNTQDVSDVQLEGSVHSSMLPVAALHYERYMLLVFDECAVPVDFYGKPCGPTINWRTPITHAIKMGPNTIMVVSKGFTAEVWNITGGGELVVSYASSQAKSLTMLRGSKNFRSMFVRVESAGDGREPQPVCYSVVDVVERAATLE